MNDTDIQERQETVNAAASNVTSAGNTGANPSVTTGDWFLTILITAIPLIGLIMLFVWAFGGGANENKSSWAKAMLIWVLILGVIAGILAYIVYKAYTHRYSWDM
ncbi:MAG TPA: hypothetical protein VHP38_03290 [Ruminiclostridium sp.]|nr:hypothetical protein [Ruminiclostridium sp.]